MTSSFRAFAPTEEPQYYIPGTKDYKYLTPVNDHNLLPKIFLVRSELQDKENAQNALALFKHHINHKLEEPELDSFFVEGYGIIPAKYLICEGETHMDYSPTHMDYSPLDPHDGNDASDASFA
jgi:hypothetical protein